MPGTCEHCRFGYRKPQFDVLASGANPNLQDSNGNTALHHASMRSHTDVFPILIEHGASLDLENTDGRAAVEVAETDEIAELLREAGAGE